MIIFDEFDAIGKSRGRLVGDGSGVRDSVVNQLLSKMDGVGQLNNVLVIGITNRIDLIDDALLRPGRFEVHLEIIAPTLIGRSEILAILLRPIVQQHVIAVETATEVIIQLAEVTDGWSGAELAGLVRSAVAFALERSFTEDVKNETEATLSITLSNNDLLRGYKEMKNMKKRHFFVTPGYFLQNRLKRFVRFFSSIRRTDELTSEAELIKVILKMLEVNNEDMSILQNIDFPVDISSVSIRGWRNRRN